MGLEIPDSVTWLSWIVGSDWPEGDETAMRRAGEAWYDATGEIKELVGELQGAAAGVRGTLNSGAAQKFQESWDKWVTTDPQLLVKLEEACTKLGEALDEGALEIEYAKYMFIGLLIITAIEIAFLLAWAFATFGASAAAIPGVQAAAQFTARIISKELLERLMARLTAKLGSKLAARVAIGAGIGGLQGFGLDAAVQGVQMAKGDRQTFDVSRNLSSGVDGIIGGALSGGLTHAAGKIPGLGEVDGDAALRALGRGAAREGLGESGGSVASALVAGAMHGQMPTGEEVAKAATSGAFGGAVGGGKDGIKGGDLPNPNLHLPTFSPENSPTAGNGGGPSPTVTPTSGGTPEGGGNRISNLLGDGGGQGGGTSLAGMTPEGGGPSPGGSFQSPGPSVGDGGSPPASPNQPSPAPSTPSSGTTPPVPGAVPTPMAGAAPPTPGATPSGSTPSSNTPTSANNSPNSPSPGNNSPNSQPSGSGTPSPNNAPPGTSGPPSRAGTDPTPESSGGTATPNGTAPPPHSPADAPAHTQDPTAPSEPSAPAAPSEGSPTGPVLTPMPTAPMGPAGGPTPAAGPPTRGAQPSKAQAAHPSERSTSERSKIPADATPGAAPRAASEDGSPADRPHSDDTDPPRQDVPEGLPDRLHDVWRGSDETPAGRSFHTDPAMRDLAQRVPADPHHFVIDGHGDRNGITVNGRRLNADQVAALIRNDPNWNSRDILLLSCRTGDGDFAHQLAQRLGVPVTAPRGTAWSDNNGNVYASTKQQDPDGKPRPTWPPDGGWNTHTPDGGTTPAGRDGFAPGHPAGAPHPGDPDGASSRPEREIGRSPADDDATHAQKVEKLKPHADRHYLRDGKAVPRNLENGERLHWDKDAGDWKKSTVKPVIKAHYMGANQRPDTVTPEQKRDRHQEVETRRQALDDFKRQNAGYDRDTATPEEKAARKQLQREVTEAGQALGDRAAEHAADDLSRVYGQVPEHDPRHIDRGAGHLDDVRRVIDADGRTRFVLIEAKGPEADPGHRLFEGDSYQQGHPKYLEAILGEMQARGNRPDHPTNPGTNTHNEADLARDLKRALRQKRLDYYLVTAEVDSSNPARHEYAGYVRKQFNPYFTPEAPASPNTPGEPPAGAAPRSADPEQQAAAAEEAISRNAATFPDRDAAYDYGGRHWNDYADNLPQDQKDAVHHYADEPPSPHPTYQDINGALRDGGTPDPDVRQHIDAIDRALAGRPTPEDLVVTRGTDLGHLNIDPRAMVGRTFTDPGYLSTSLGAPAGSALFKEAVLHLRVPAGTPALWVEQVSPMGAGERELLLARGLHFKVDEVVHLDGKWQVYGNIVPAEPPTPPPPARTPTATTPPPRVFPTLFPTPTAPAHTTPPNPAPHTPTPPSPPAPTPMPGPPPTSHTPSGPPAPTPTASPAPAPHPGPTAHTPTPPVPPAPTPMPGPAHAAPPSPAAHTPAPPVPPAPTPTPSAAPKSPAPSGPSAPTPTASPAPAAHPHPAAHTPVPLSPPTPPTTPGPTPTPSAPSSASTPPATPSPTPVAPPSPAAHTPAPLGSPAPPPTPGPTHAVHPNHVAHTPASPGPPAPTPTPSPAPTSHAPSGPPAPTPTPGPTHASSEPSGASAPTPTTSAASAAHPNHAVHTPASSGPSAPTPVAGPASASHVSSGSAASAPNARAASSAHPVSDPRIRYGWYSGGDSGGPARGDGERAHAPASDGARPAAPALLHPYLHGAWHSSSPTPAGRTFHSPAEPGLVHRARQIAPNPGRFVVDGRGGPDGLIVDGRRLGPDEVADLIRNDPSWNRRSILLLTDQSGNSPFAEQLAQRLGTPVVAPLGPVRVDANGQSTARNWAVHEPRPAGPPRMNVPAPPTGPRPHDPLPGTLGPDQVRRFGSDQDGSDYGENHLGSVYAGLPQHLQHAVHAYTTCSEPNPFLRPAADGTVNPGRRFGDYVNHLTNEHNSLWTLANANGGVRPDAAGLQRIYWDPNASPQARDLAGRVLSSDDPNLRMQQMVRSSEHLGRLAQHFGAPTPEAFERRIAELDAALSRPLPEAVQVQRGLHDLRFMVAQDGSALGARIDANLLVGTVQTDQAYMSTSLGAEPAVVDGRPFPHRIHMTMPEGSRGLWMGTNSAYPGQRELLLPRGVQYRIDAVVPNGRRDAQGNPAYDIWATAIPAPPTGGPLPPGPHPSAGHRAAPNDAPPDPAAPDDHGVPEGLRDVWRGSDQTPAGRSFHTDPAMRDLAQRVPADPHHFVIDGHGDRNGMTVNGRRLNADQVAALIRNDPNWNSRDILLLSCRTGDGDFAHQLAQRLGVPVTAPHGLAWSDNNGNVYASADRPGADGSPRPTWPPDGGWNTHTPDGSTTPTGRDGFAPGHPRTQPTGDAAARNSTSEEERLRSPERDAYRRNPQHQLQDDDLRPQRFQPPQVEPDRVRPQHVRPGDPFLHENFRGDTNARYDVYDGRTNDAGDPVPRARIHTGPDGRVTHVDGLLPNLRRDHPDYVANPDISGPLPGVDYRVQVGEHHQLYRTDENGMPPDAVQFNATPPGRTVEVPGRDGANADGVKAPNPHRPFNVDQNLKPHTRYLVSDTSGNLRGAFSTDSEGTVRWVDTPSGRFSGKNPELTNLRADVHYRVSQDFDPDRLPPGNDKFTPGPETKTVRIVNDTEAPSGMEAFCRRRGLAPDTRYVVHDKNGQPRGIFYTDSTGAVRIVDTYRPFNPDLNHPIPNAQYSVDGRWLFETGPRNTGAGRRPEHRTDTVASTGRNIAKAHHPEPGPPRWDNRHEGSQQRSGGLGPRQTVTEESGRQITQNVLDGGHTQGHQFNGPGELINMVAQLRAQNQGNNDGVLGLIAMDTWHAMEGELARIGGIAAHIPSFNVFVLRDPGEQVPHHIQVRWVEMVNGIPTVRVRGFDNA